jgi:predicted transposase/invertase (TIGR01784 family)
MKQVVSLQYDVIFKKAFSKPEIFKAFVKAVLGIELEITNVDMEKTFDSKIGRVKSRFDLFAEDVKKRVIVDIQHKQHEDYYDRFLHYHCMAILEQVKNSKDYHPQAKVFTIVVLTSENKQGKDVLTIDFDPKDLQGKGIGKIPHKVIYLCPAFVNENTPVAYREWLEAINDTLDGEVDESNYHDASIKEIFDLIEEDSITPEERYEMFEETHRQEEIVTERLEGKTEGKKEIAKNMLDLNLAIEIIAQTTGLTLSEIEKLANPLLNDEEK